jgi:hypothetical protein
MKEMNELTQLKRARYAYCNATSDAEFNAAEKVLLKFHKKYGTIDESIIRELIN